LLTKDLGWAILARRSWLFENLKQIFFGKLG
jgi:hypothetical protein